MDVFAVYEKDVRPGLIPQKTEEPKMFDIQTPDNEQPATHAKEAFSLGDLTESDRASLYKEFKEMMLAEMQAQKGDQDG